MAKKKNKKANAKLTTVSTAESGNVATVKKKKVVAKKQLTGLSFENKFWVKNLVPSLLLFLLAFGLYISSVGFEYVLDDQIVLTKNNFVKKGFGGIKDILTTESMTGYFGEQKNLIVGGRYRPLSIVTFAIEYGFFGANSKVSHFINVLLYGLTGLLLFRILSILFPIKENQKWYFSMPFIASLLFVLHPIHSEVVANVKGRDEIMTLMGSLAAMYYSLKYVKTEKIYLLILSAITFFLALLSKENALTFIAVIPFSIYFFSNTSFKKIAMVTVPLLLVGVGFIALRTGIIGYFLDSGKEVTDLMNNPFADMNGSQKYATIVYTLLVYLKLLVFPVQLTHDYYPYHIPIMNWGDWRVILSLFVHLALGVIALLGLKKKSVLSYAIIFYFATLSITSNLPFTVGTFMNERFVYISSIGFCIALAYLLLEKLPQLNSSNAALKMAGQGIIGLFCLGFIAKTIVRVPAWETPLTLNSAAIKVSKNSARANCFMGTAIFENYKVEQDQTKKQAMLNDINYYIDRSLEINPRYGSALTMKGGLIAEDYRFNRDIDQLLTGFEKVLKIKRNHSFIEQYVEYLISSGKDDLKVANFCYRIGHQYFAQQLRDRTYATKYINYGLQADPNNAQLLQARGMLQ